MLKDHKNSILKYYSFFVSDLIMQEILCEALSGQVLFALVNVSLSIFPYI